MISSRRLAREWALKILYQMDVGKFTPQEAQESALERLRMEFVHRGSRTASGSNAEEVCLNAITLGLRDTLPTLRLPLERAMETAAGRLFEEAPYWQELRTERPLKTQLPGILISPPRLLTPLDDIRFYPSSSDLSDGLAVHVAQLTPQERTRYMDFIIHARTELPSLLDTEFRKNARTFAKQLASDRPFTDVSDWLLEQRRDYNQQQAERWRKVGQMVQKQTGDWLRTAAFTLKLAAGAHTHRKEVDHTITSLSSGWSLERQVAVDRNILRMAGYEMLFLPTIPTAATINEAVELAKKYSTTESGRFVNGVLGALANRVGDKLAPNAEQDAIESDSREDIVDLPDIELDETTE